MAGEPAIFQMKKIEILGQVITSQYGVLQTGEIVSVSEDMAAYLIGEKQAKECAAVDVEKKVKAK
jgi:hypothetical protein